TGPPPSRPRRTRGAGRPSFSPSPPCHLSSRGSGPAPPRDPSAGALSWRTAPDASTRPEPACLHPCDERGRAGSTRAAPAGTPDAPAAKENESSQAPVGTWLASCFSWNGDAVRRRLQDLPNVTRAPRWKLRPGAGSKYRLPNAFTVTDALYSSSKTLLTTANGESDTPPSLRRSIPRRRSVTWYPGEYALLASFTGMRDARR